MGYDMRAFPVGQVFMTRGREKNKAIYIILKNDTESFEYKVMSTQECYLRKTTSSTWLVDLIEPL